MIREDLSNDHEMLQQFSLVEYYNMHHTFHNGEELTIDKLSTTNLQCFCEMMKSQVGRKAASLKEFTYTYQGEEQKKVKVCAEYLKASIWISLLALLVPLMVVISNALLKNVAIILFEWVGFENKALEISKIQNAVFALLFFNTGISILIINANL